MDQLTAVLEAAWGEIEAAPDHAMRVARRLAIYDLVIGDYPQSLLALGATPGCLSVPTATPGLQRWHALGLRTVLPLRAVWEATFDSWLECQPPAEAPYLAPFKPMLAILEQVTLAGLAGQSAQGMADCWRRRRRGGAGGPRWSMCRI